MLNPVEGRAMGLEGRVRRGNAGDGKRGRVWDEI